MTDTIEQKALALVNEVEPEIEPWLLGDIKGEVCFEPLCRAIEQHEAFRQEVSDACNAVWDLDTFGREQVKKFLSRFIIAKPDPLVEALEEWINSRDLDDAASFRAAIEKRGGKIVWGEG